MSTQEAPTPQSPNIRPVDWFERGAITVVRAVIADVKSSSDTYLMLHRNSDHARHPDLWELPGGQIDPNSEDPYQSVEDEIEAKTGLAVRLDSRNFSCIEYRTMEDRTADEGRLYIAYAGVARCIGGSLKLNPEEHSDSRWALALNSSYQRTTPQADVTLALHRASLLGAVDVAGPYANPEAYRH